MGGGRGGNCLTSGARLELELVVKKPGVKQPLFLIANAGHITPKTHAEDGNRDKYSVKHKGKRRGEREERAREREREERLGIYTAAGTAGPSSHHFKGQRVTQMWRQTDQESRQC